MEQAGPETHTDDEEWLPLTPREQARRWLKLFSYGGMIILSMAALQYMVYSSATGTWTEAARVQRVASSDAPAILRGGGETLLKPQIIETSEYGEDLSVAQLREAALNGDPRAQNRLGEIYANGRGIARNDKAAAQWFERGALRGLARAQYNLAVWFRDGRGVARNPARAVFWYLRAAKQGHARAQYDLARLYANGVGVPKDPVNAVKWHGKAAKSGLAAAQFALGEIYEHGSDLPHSKVAALEWYRKAALQDHPEALKRFRMLLSAGVIPDRTALRKMDPRHGRKETEAQRKARIAEIQTLLARLNFRPGANDGSIGQGTRRAIRLYQQLAGRKVDGKPSPELLEDLRAAAGTVSGGG